MDRREALRLLATGAALQLAPSNLFAVLREARTLLAAEGTPRILNPHQNATVRTIAELILPKSDTPGASDVGVSEFIDLMLTEWFDEPDRDRFLNGLAEVDRHTEELFGREFVGSLPDQQAEILAWLGEKMTEETEAIPPGPSPRRGASRRSSRSFYSMVRHLTLTAYYTSEAGATEALHFQIIPDSHDGCAEVPSAKSGAQN